jgi:hypothetical protein
MVQAYLLEKWGLMALGITTNILGIVQQGFVGSEVIVLDGSPSRTCFLHNALRDVFSTDMQAGLSVRPPARTACLPALPVRPPHLPNKEISNIFEFI